MAFDGFGNFTRDFNWEADKDADIPITASRMDAEFNNFANGMNELLLRTGIAPMSGNLKMGANKITGVASGADDAPSIQFSADVTTGFFLASAGALAFTAAGTERGRFTTTGAKITGTLLVTEKVGIITATPRTAFDVGGGIMSIRGAFEDVVTSATAITGTVQVNYVDGAVVMFTSDAAGNFTFNIRGDASTSLDSLMAAGQMLTVAIEVPQGTTAYYCTAITVDGGVPSEINWSQGAPTEGNPSGVDVYLIRVVKTGANTFKVRASQSQEK